MRKTTPIEIELPKEIFDNAFEKASHKDGAFARMTFYRMQFDAMCNTVGSDVDAAVVVHDKWVEWSGEYQKRENELWGYIEQFYPEVGAGGWNFSRWEKKLIQQEERQHPLAGLGIPFKIERDEE